MHQHAGLSIEKLFCYLNNRRIPSFNPPQWLLDPLAAASVRFVNEMTGFLSSDRHFLGLRHRNRHTKWSGEWMPITNEKGEGETFSLINQLSLLESMIFLVGH